MTENDLKQAENGSQSLSLYKVLGHVRDLIFGLVAMALVIIAFNIYFRITIVQGYSMAPTYVHGDKLFVSRRGHIDYGDVILVYEEDEDKEILKRVIGLPGDTIEVSKGNVLLNGQVLEESYLHSVFLDFSTDGIWVLGENQLFVLGDNRDVSIDSRVYGAFDLVDVFGKVLFRLS